MDTVYGWGQSRVMRTPKPIPALSHCLYCDGLHFILDETWRQHHHWDEKPTTCGYGFSVFKVCPHGLEVPHCHWADDVAQHAYLAIKSTLRPIGKDNQP